MDRREPGGDEVRFGRTGGGLEEPESEGRRIRLPILAGRPELEGIETKEELRVETRAPTSGEAPEAREEFSREPEESLEEAVGTDVVVEEWSTAWAEAGSIGLTRGRNEGPCVGCAPVTGGRTRHSDVPSAFGGAFTEEESRHEEGAFLGKGPHSLRIWLAIKATPSKLGCSPSMHSARLGGSHSSP